MEKLKTFVELTSPDKRQAFFSHFDPKIGDFRTIRAEDVYASAAEISLHAEVPEKVRSHFATALNLLAYSWFYYPFNVTAQLMGYVSLEFALKQRFPGNDRKPLKHLITRAVKEGIVTSNGFSISQKIQERNLGAQSEPDEESYAVADYATALIEAMPYLRNSLAHGSSMLHMHGASSVRTCAEFINQLFPCTVTDN